MRNEDKRVDIHIRNNTVAICYISTKWHIPGIPNPQMKGIHKLLFKGLGVCSSIMLFHGYVGKMQAVYTWHRYRDACFCGEYPVSPSDIPHPSKSWRFSPRPTFWEVLNRCHSLLCVHISSKDLFHHLDFWKVHCSMPQPLGTEPFLIFCLLLQPGNPVESACFCFNIDQGHVAPILHCIICECVYIYIYIFAWLYMYRYVYIYIHIFVGRSILCLTRFSLCPPNSPGLSPSHWLSPCNVEQGRDPLLQRTWNRDWVGWDLS